MSRFTKVTRLPRLIPITRPTLPMLRIASQRVLRNVLRSILQRRRPLRQPRLSTLAATGLGVLVAGAGYVLFAPLPLASDSDPSRVTAQNGEVIGDLVSAGVMRREASLREIPQYLQEATIAVEDSSFYQHRGLNIKGIIRALFADIRARHIVQGGSTITQQLAKNLFLNGDRTLWRKAREAVYALQLELHYSKQRILDDYLNAIYYGDGATGVATAALYYFGKPVQSLDLAESALLAGLPKGPSIYSPFVNYSTAKNRQWQVLQAMVRSRFLTASAAHAAYAAPLHFAHHSTAEAFAPYFADAVASAAEEQLHLSRDELYRGGLSIHTTLNMTLQKALDQAIARYIPRSSGLQTAAVVMDPRTGNIEAYSGGVNYRFSPYDRATAMRQPGSAFKPFVYAAALDRGYTAAMHMKSEPTTFIYDRYHRYTVHNFGDDYAYTQIDMKQAIAHSDNVFAVSANLALGPKTVVQEAERFGLPTNMKPYPSLALGVFPVSTLQLARAYSVFASGGYLSTPHFIESVQDASGHNVYREQTNSLLVESPATCYILTDMLQSVMRPGGTGYRVARSIPGPVAAKTGTTDTDAWIVGYTPKTVCAVWIGYDRMKPISGVESHIAAPIFADVMKAAYTVQPQGTFRQPGNVATVAIDPENGQRATAACPLQERDAFVAGTEPTQTCALHPVQEEGLATRISGALQSAWGWLTGRK